MTDLPTIAILFLTKEVEGRENIAVATIEALREYMKYEGPYVWVFACGKSSQEYRNSIYQALHGDDLGWIVQADKPPGVVWNLGIDMVHTRAWPAYLRVEDDMVLKDHLDITPYVKLLMEREDVGMVRLGLMPIGLDLHSTAHDGRIYFDVLKSQPYQYSGNPGLIHKRFHDAYGMFHEEKNPGEIEVEFDYRVRSQEGPKIWWPMKMGTYTFGYWDHRGAVKSYSTEGEES
jgi:hypothetical protein